MGIVGGPGGRFGFLNLLDFRVRKIIERNGSRRRQGSHEEEINKSICSLFLQELFFIFWGGRHFFLYKKKVRIISVQLQWVPNFKYLNDLHHSLETTTLVHDIHL